jgi:hypothetical protein
LTHRRIDPNFIIGFFTIIALFLSLIQGSKDKKYSYNLKLIDSIEDKGIKVISKLLGIKNKSSKVLNCAQDCIKAKNEQKVFVDVIDAFSKEDIDNEMELIASYVDLYFPELKGRWNDLIDKLNAVAQITSNIKVNYEKNIELIQSGTKFQNIALDNAETSLKEAIKIDQEIESLTSAMRDKIVVIINDSKGKLKNTAGFKI